jgi:hypothetical protein
MPSPTLRSDDGYPKSDDLPVDRLAPWPNRLLNILFGAVYTAIISLTMRSGAHFIFYGVIEMALTLLVVFYGWTWPRRP